MGVVEWSAMGGIATAMVAIVGALVRVVDRLNKAESTASDAHVRVTAIDLELDHAKTELVEHRVTVAREYVSKEMLMSAETKIVEAINRLGDRLDALIASGRH